MGKNNRRAVPYVLFLAFVGIGLWFARGVNKESLQKVDPQPETGYGWEEKSSVVGQEFMISTANPLATDAGYMVLRSGGTAVDAMIAVQLVLNLVEPMSSGIGGGAFMLYWDAQTRELVTYDGRETAPQAAKPERFIEANGQKMSFAKAITGGHSVGVPGVLRLMEMAHKRYGNQSWGALFQPAIEIAQQGFKVSPRLAKSISSASTRGLPLAVFPAVSDYFFDELGAPLKAGALLKNTDFAQTLRLIA